MVVNPQTTSSSIRHLSNTSGNGNSGWQHQGLVGRLASAMEIRRHIFMEINKAKCKILHKVLHMGWGNPKHKYRLEGGEWFGNSTEKNFEWWFSRSLSWASNVHAQSRDPKVSWVASKGVWAGEGRGFCPSVSHWWDPSGVLHAALGPSV